jgi:hypothetical protein
MTATADFKTKGGFMIRPAPDPGIPLKVPFTEQQLVLLRQLIEDGRYGSTIEQVCMTIYRDYTAQLFGGDGRSA